METRAHHVLIGLFTVAMVAGAVLFALWLAEATADETDVYDIVFQEAVTGLSVGSRVLYNGVQVGTVEDIKLDPEDPRQVVARIRVDSSTPVKHDTRAELVLANITGAAEIQLSGGSPESPPIKGEEGDVPRIIADPSPLARLRGTSAELFNNITSLIESGSRLLSEENLVHISRSLEQLSRFSGTLAEQGDTIDEGLQNLLEVTRQSDETIRQANQLLQRMDGLVDAQGEEVLTRAVQTMTSLERAAANVDQLLLENEEALASGMQGLSGLGPAIEDLRETLTTLESFARRLEEDPANYLLGRESVREFEP